MLWINLVTILACLQYIAFAMLVGRARGKYGVNAPATSGHEMFDRFYRVQMNTLELMVVFIPALHIAAQYWQQTWIAAIGSVYLLGRMVYLRAYVQSPTTRALGFMLSFIPIIVLLLAVGAGIFW